MNDVLRRTFDRSIAENRYPGRGLIIGRNELGEWALVYWIMGRSDNSRNRQFVAEGGTLRTQAYDARRLVDPSLIIYEAMLELPGVQLVSNGDQTRTIHEALSRGSSFEAALSTRAHEPDAPHYTPRLPEGYVMNDLTLDLLARASVTHAEAGADIIAPSGVIDGMVGASRAGLDANGFEHVAILSYAAKYASGFYGPFREAAESPPQFGDRSQYQMDPANRREALREVALDVAEGADMLMVKPALPYLDVLSAVRQAYGLPTDAASAAL